MEKRVSETEKVSDIYKNLVSGLPEWVEEYKTFINKSKDDVIAKLQQDKSEDEQVKEARRIELKRLEVQEKMVAELPKLRDQLITAFEAIEERIDAMEPNMFIGYNPRLTLKPKDPIIRFNDIYEGVKFLDPVNFLQPEPTVIEIESNEGKTVEEDKKKKKEDEK